MKRNDEFFPGGFCTSDTCFAAVLMALGGDMYEYTKKPDKDGRVWFYFREAPWMEGAHADFYSATEAHPGPDVTSLCKFRLAFVMKKNLSKLANGEQPSAFFENFTGSYHTERMHLSPNGVKLIPKILPA